MKVQVLASDTVFSFPDRGVGRSRNEAILRAEGDICIFADADIVYEPGYAEAIAEEFRSNSDADMILFNVTIQEERRTYCITGRKRVHWYNCERYGAVSFAVRRDSLLESGVTFSLLFGGGAKYGSGEDSLFLKEFMFLLAHRNKMCGEISLHQAYRYMKEAGRSR